MQVYIFVDNPNFEEEESFLSQLGSIVAEQTPFLEFVDRIQDSNRHLGVLLQPKEPKHLIAPLNALYALAKTLNCEFVVGVVNGGDYEDVCFFGKEEGKPDAFEIASYLGDF